ncbi:NADH-quinone oxidoreductase subunit NuoE [Xinfangfangia sp. D13-10-4-6]|uniref:NADH-quinone oxidoreductase subunit NuoE n=1 Tax=Pseudogemmobacter hezensis TaxID=2737662 RepID=UPI001555E15B|nr:NADH-quinone oxidoreductase subunit NuoE [Pseudogemmobacter hezensis]NPD15234.1 NADH-quinone oxidoreductase subunit NuoE [Pseudogemmobacter hezensis]
MLRRLYHEQPASFAFTPANLEWAKGQITKYPEGRQASAVIPLLWRAQEQEGWLSKPAIEYVASMLGMANIRVLEVATFYFMFQLQPVGSVANIQICGTTSCMICGAEDLVSVCKELIAPTPHTVSADGKFSWEEVECLGACANAPMAQIGKDYYEDLTPAVLRGLIARFREGEVPQPGSQNGRYSSEPLNNLTSLKDHQGTGAKYNGSVQRALDIGETVKRIDGTEVPLNLSWLRNRGAAAPVAEAAPAKAAAADAAPSVAPATATPATVGRKPEGLAEARDGKADNLKEIEGIGPAMEKLCHELGFFHYDQIAAWSEEEIAWVDENLKGFKGRVTRDKWVAQAKLIVAEGLEAFRIRAKTNDY